MGRWSTRVDETQTGALVADVEQGSIAWGRGDETTRTSDIILAGFDRTYWRGVLDKGWDHKITHLCDGRPVYSGLIQGHPAYDRPTRTLSVSHVSPMILPSKRWPHGVGTSEGEGGYDPSGYFEVTGRTLQGALVDVLERALVAPIVPAWPIAALIPSSTPGSFSKRWPFYEFASTGDMIGYLQNIEDGPDWDMQPVMQGDEVWWQVRVGAPLVGTTLFELHLDAPDSGVESWSRDSDDSETVTGIHFPGKGSEEDMRVGAAFLPGSAGLARDTIDENKNESNVDRLSAQARGLLGGLTQPTVTWTLKVSIDRIHPADIRIGSPLRLHLWDDDPWMPEKVDTTVVSYSGDESDFYTINAQEV